MWGPPVSQAEVERLSLLVIGDQVATHWLPTVGQVSIGSGADCDLRVDEPSVAPLHAILHLGAELTLEDARSGEPTRVLDAPLAPGECRRLWPGQPVTLGDALLVLQRKGRGPQPRRIWTHGYFESRLEEECLRAERFGSEFALLRLHTPEKDSAKAIEDVLANLLRMVDVVGMYGPGEYEVLLPETPAANVQVVTERLAAKLSKDAPGARIGSACYPKDGRSADALEAVAGAGARGESVEPPVESALLGKGAMQQLDRLVDRIAAGMISVLVLGETGVGKERLAERIHQRSQRAKGPFLRLNCSALSESLLESELFGHEKGSFTGAVQAKKGLLETAQGGTAFFDEVGELSLSMQVKLLRVIEERQATRVGGLRPYSIDVRFVSATNRDLELAITEGRFREDLYFRLNGITLVIPPLRERVDEIPGLVSAFITDTCRRSHRQETPKVSPAALALLKGYTWPGNIRELRNVIERAVLLCSGHTLTPEHFAVERMSSTFAPRRPSMPFKRPPPAPPAAAAAALSLPAPSHPLTPLPPPATGDKDVSMATGARQELQSYERRRIAEALTRCAGNQSEAARMLGISRRTLLNRLDAYGLPRPRKGRGRAS